MITFALFTLGITCLVLGVAILIKRLMPWTDWANQIWIVLSTVFSILGLVLIGFALVHTYGWVSTGLFLCAGGLLNIGHYRWVKRQANEGAHTTFDHNDHSDPLDEARA